MKQLFIFTGLMVILCSSSGFAEDNDICLDASGYSCNKIVDAIYRIEGGKNTNYPFGIKSVKCDGYDECRQVCLNTVRNNVNRWRKAEAEGDTRDYLTFLYHRYCPPQAHHLNAHWLKNLLSILNQE